jgi:hypothetical protein
MQLKKECTLLELVQSVSESALTDEEVVTIVAYLVNSGQVRLCGNFAGAKIRLEPSFSPCGDTLLSPPPPFIESLLAA